MGADKAVHLSDEALAGSDAVQTARALAKAIGTVEGVDLVVAGNEASDGRSAAVPAMVADVLGLPALTHAREVTVEGSSVTVKRETDDGITTLTAELPAVVSVGEKINEPRYPSFKGIMAAKKKPVETLSLNDLGLSGDDVAVKQNIVELAAAEERKAGEVIQDEGEGAKRIADFLQEAKVI
jgi:electron transfer flavoprotein beta subunit